MKHRTRIWMDISGSRLPIRGEFIVTKGKRGWGTAYLIIGARIVERRTRKTPETRVSLTVEPGHSIEDAIACDPWILHWYSRQKRVNL